MLYNSYEMQKRNRVRETYDADRLCEHRARGRKYM
jgi:hypothetical protein